MYLILEGFVLLLFQYDMCMCICFLLLVDINQLIKCLGLHVVDYLDCGIPCDRELTPPSHTSLPHLPPTPPSCMDQCFVPCWVLMMCYSSSSHSISSSPLQLTCTKRFSRTTHTMKPFTSHCTYQRSLLLLFPKRRGERTW